jgi:hypothetical protein
MKHWALLLVFVASGTSSGLLANDQRIFLDPSRPSSSFYVIERLPSFIFMPDAPLRVAYVQGSGGQVRGISGSYRTTPASATSPGGDMDCADFIGQVMVGGNDPHGLDADGDGIGCE